MGCGGSKDDIVKIEIKNTPSKSQENPLSHKELAINSIFAKNDEESDILIQDTDRKKKKKEYVRPKLNLVKRQGPTARNVNLLIEDNTKVFELH